MASGGDRIPHEESFIENVNWERAGSASEPLALSLFGRLGSHEREQFEGGAIS
jgi:hypothetical protein